MALLLSIAVPASLNSAGVSDIKSSLNKNGLSDQAGDFPGKSRQDVKPSKPARQIKPSAKTSKPAISIAKPIQVSSKKLVQPPHSMYRIENFTVGSESVTVKIPERTKPSNIKIAGAPAKKKSQPVRIGGSQSKAPARIDKGSDMPPEYNPPQPLDIKLTDFPGDGVISPNLEGEESEAVNILKAIHNEIANGADENAATGMYMEFVKRYPSYRYLCALARFYLEEARLLRSNGYVYTGTAYYEAYLRLLDCYSIDKNSNNAIVVFIRDGVKARLETISANDSQIRKENIFLDWSNHQDGLAREMKKLEERTYTQSPWYSDVPDEKSIWEIYLPYIEQYRQVVRNCLAMRDLKGAAAAMKEYENFYDTKIRKSYNIKYFIWNEEDVIHTKKVEITRDAEDHLKFMREYVAKLSYLGEVGAGVSGVKAEIEKYVRVMEGYKKAEPTDAIAGERIDDALLNDYKEYAASSSIGNKNNYYRNEMKITSSAITRAEAISLETSDFPGPRETLKLWYFTDGSAPQYAFAMTVNFKSTTSRRSKDVTMDFRPDSMAPAYCAAFLPNETDVDEEVPPQPPTPPVPDPPTPPQPPPANALASAIKIGARKAPGTGITYKNLINTTKDGLSESIACFESETVNVMLNNIYKLNRYFFNDKNEHYCLGYAFDIKYCALNITFYNNPDQTLHPDLLHVNMSENYLRSGGIEYIAVKPFDSNIQKQTQNPRKSYFSR